MDPDDVEYRKSVRNMALVLAAIVITAFAAIFIPPYFSSSNNVYVPNVSETSPFGFVLHLSVNSTFVPPSGSVLITGWVNNTYGAIEDINASNSWGLSQGQLVERACTAGWPIGIGVMMGHYTDQNYSSGTLLNLPRPAVQCPVSTNTPKDFIFRPHSSQALVTVGGTTAEWNIVTSVDFKGVSTSGTSRPGVYTALIADEWGDVLTMIIQVT